MWQDYFQPQALDDALALLARHSEDARIVAGGTDIIVELSRGIRPTSTLIDVTAIPGLRHVALTDGRISRGAAGPGLLGGGRATDPHPRHHRWQPHHRVAGQRHDYAARRARRRDRLGERPRRAESAIGRLLPWGAANCAGAGRAPARNPLPGHAREPARSLCQARAPSSAGDLGYR